MGVPFSRDTGSGRPPAVRRWCLLHHGVQGKRDIAEILKLSVRGAGRCFSSVACPPACLGALPTQAPLVFVVSEGGEPTPELARCALLVNAGHQG